jgi:hypothetical protein
MAALYIVFPVQAVISLQGRMAAACFFQNVILDTKAVEGAT